MYFNQTLMGCSSFNIDGVSKRVAYSEFVNNATTWHRKIQLSRWTILGPMYFNQTLSGCSSLNIDGVSKRVTYSEFVNKMLQHGIEKSNFPDGPF